MARRRRGQVREPPGGTVQGGAAGVDGEEASAPRREFHAQGPDRAADLQPGRVAAAGQRGEREGTFALLVPARGVLPGVLLPGVDRIEDALRVARGEGPPGPAIARGIAGPSAAATRLAVGRGDRGVPGKRLPGPLKVRQEGRRQEHLVARQPGERRHLGHMCRHGGGLGLQALPGAAAAGTSRAMPRRPGRPPASGAWCRPQPVPDGVFEEGVARRGAELGGNGSEDVVVGVSIGAVGRHENHLVGGAPAHGRRLRTASRTAARICFPVPGELTVGQAQALPRHVPGPVPDPGKAFQGVAELLQPDRGELFRRRRWRAGVRSFPRRAQQHADRGADGVQPGQQPAGPERLVVRVRGQDNEGPAGERRVIQRQVRQPGGTAAGPGGLGASRRRCG